MLLVSIPNMLLGNLSLSVDMRLDVERTDDMDVVDVFESQRFMDALTLFESQRFKDALELLESQRFRELLELLESLRNRDVLLVPQCPIEETLIFGLF